MTHIDPELNYWKFVRTKLKSVFEEQEPIRVAGILQSPVGMCWTQGETEWTLSACLIAWRPENFTLRREILKLQMQTSKQRGSQLMDQINSRPIFYAQCRISENNTLGEAHGLIVDILDSPALDEELIELHRLLQEPVHLEHDCFGKLVLERSYDWYTGEIDWDGNPIMLYLSFENEGDEHQSATVAKFIWDNRVMLVNQFKQLALQELFAVKNESWLDEGQEPINEQEFLETLTPKSLLTYPDGAYEFSFDDNDLFWGHDVVVRGTLESGPEDVALEG